MAKQSPFWLTPKGLSALGLIGAASYFLLMEHRAHLVQWLPFLILLLCPLMHLFMHHGHGHGHDGRDGDPHRQHSEAAEKKAYRRGFAAGRAKSKRDQEQ